MTLVKVKDLLHDPSMRTGEITRTGKARSEGGFLLGKVLVAMPTMRDERFIKSVIYICAHSKDGAMGLVINHAANQIRFGELLTQLGIARHEDQPPGTPIKVLRGGPVETGRGFVLHSDDVFIDNASMLIEDGVCLTATLDILKAIALGEGPSNAVLALGYAGWGSGQLEDEIHANGWLYCDPDADLLFDPDIDTKYDRALKKIGIDPGMLSMDAGHA